MRRRTGSIQWQPLSGNSVKANFDGAMFEEEQEAGIGVVIRNNEGQVLAALSEKVRMPATVEICWWLGKWQLLPGNSDLVRCVLKVTQS